MADYTPSRITIDSEILQLLEAISRKQGELSAIKRDLQIENRIESMAAIDAVHFSTKIEGNALTRDQVTQALTSKKKAGTRDLKEILNYSRTRKMLREWVSKDKSLTDDWILRHHHELLEGIVKGKLRGHYRQAQCVIQDSKSRAIVYMAPEWREVPELMSALLRWLRQQLKARTSPLLLAAQFHYEFVTIHPFMDGNGRLARLLTNSLLSIGGHDLERYAALEKQHEQSRQVYYRELRALQAGNYYDIPPEQDIRSWVLYWLRCVSLAYDEALERLTEQGPAHNNSDYGKNEHTSARLQKAEALFRRHQKLRASEYADLMSLGRTQAVADLNSLVKAGKIEKVGGGRSTLYRCLMTLV